MTSCLRFLMAVFLVTYSAGSSCPSETWIDEVSLAGSSCSSETWGDEVSLLQQSVATQLNRHQLKVASEMTNAKPGDKYGGAHAESSSKCGAIVKAVLAAHGPNSDKPFPADIPGRIDAMMGVQFDGATYPEASKFDTDCCGAGTEYDKFIESKVIKPIETDVFMNAVNKQSMLIIVDVQRDFVDGSFGQPCWGQVGQKDRGDAFAEAIAKLATDMAAKGATIIISKDFHPSNHCSFGGTGNCKNKKDATEKADERYINSFPSHCTFTMKNGIATPQKGSETPFCQDEGHKGLPFCSNDAFVGASLHPTIEKLFWTLPPNQVELVFKGINKDYDSFSVIPHTASKNRKLEDAEVKWTGGYALSGSRKNECLKTKDLENPKCYPTDQEIKILSGMRSMTEIMTKQGTKDLVSVGLVSDFCVKETSIFALEWDKTMKSTAFANLARPSFDGKPGVPWAAAACGGAHEGDFCTSGGGTSATAAAVFADYKNAGVEVKLWNPAAEGPSQK